VVLTPLDLSLRLGTDATEAGEFATLTGQGAQLLQGQPQETLLAARSVLVEFFKQYEGPKGVDLPAALWLVSARA
jgi:hypothetical protein